MHKLSKSGPYKKLAEVKVGARRAQESANDAVLNRVQTKRTR